LEAIRGELGAGYRMYDADLQGYSVFNPSRQAAGLPAHAAQRCRGAKLDSPVAETPVIEDTDECPTSTLP